MITIHWWMLALSFAAYSAGMALGETEGLPPSRRAIRVAFYAFGGALAGLLNGAMYSL